MNLAFSETGSVRGFHLHTLSFFLLIFSFIGLLFFIYIQYQAKIEEEMVRRGEVPAYLKERIAELEAEKELQQKQIRLFAEELGILQARLDRFDAIGEKIMQDPTMGKGFDATPEFGGKGGYSEPTKTDKIPSLEDMHDVIRILQDRADGLDTVMNASMKLMATQEIAKSQKPYLWPVLYEKTYISSPFGYRNDPFSKTKRRFHSGTDFVAPRGSPIVSAGDGIVVFAGYRYSYGISVEIRHAHGFTTRYAHMDSTVVKNGQPVRAGDQVGTLGSTGRSTGPHLHFEMLIDDTKVDPYPFVVETKQEMINRARQLASNTRK